MINFLKELKYFSLPALSRKLVGDTMRDIAKNLKTEINLLYRVGIEHQHVTPKEKQEFSKISHHVLTRDSKIGEFGFICTKWIYKEISWRHNLEIECSDSDSWCSAGCDTSYY